MLAVFARLFWSGLEVTVALASQNFTPIARWCVCFQIVPAPTMLAGGRARNLQSYKGCGVENNEGARCIGCPPQPPGQQLHHG